MFFVAFEKSHSFYKVSAVILDCVTMKIQHRLCGLERTEISFSPLWRLMVEIRVQGGLALGTMSVELHTSQFS